MKPLVCKILFPLQFIWRTIFKQRNDAVPFQFVAFLLDRKGEGTFSCYITEAYEGQMNTIDVIHNVVNFGMSYIL